MKKIYLFILITCLSFAGIRPAAAQTDAPKPAAKKGLPKTSDYRNWMVGVHFGLTEANTDIATSDFSQRKFGFGARVTKSLTHNFGLQANFQTGKIAGENKDLTFENDLNWEATLNIVMTIGNLTFIDKTNRLNLYAFFGYGFLSYDKATVYWKNLDSTSFGEAETVGTIPFGAGLKFKLNDRFVLHGEYSLHTTSEDLIDGRLVNLSENDYYTYINLGVNYILGKQEKSIEWVNPFATIYADLYDVKDRVDLMSGDLDKDGVADMFDKEPATPAGVKVYGDGTSVDADGDGVPDHLDADPFSSKGAKVDGSGKESDSDGDSVPDSRDLEPGTDKGKLVDARGIGIPGINMEGGKATIERSSVESVYLPSVFFRINSVTVDAAYNEDLASVALILKSNPSINLDLIGNCDISASEPYNQKLGEKRADAVKNVLVKKFHVDSARLNVVSKGETEVLSKNDYRMDRRVDFKISK